MHPVRRSCTGTWRVRRQRQGRRRRLGLGRCHDPGRAYLRGIPEGVYRTELSIDELVKKGMDPSTARGRGQGPDEDRLIGPVDSHSAARWNGRGRPDVAAHERSYGRRRHVKLMEAYR